MSWKSALYPGELVVNDFTADLLLGDTEAQGYCRGYIPRPSDFDTGVAAPFDIPLIPRDQWAGLIEERERRGQLLSQIVLKAGIPSLDQGRTNYCWANAVVTAIETLRCAQGQSYVKLSSASVAAPIKGFRNVGGFGSEALQFITQRGAVPASLWPANAIDRRYDTTEAREAARPFVVKEWYDVIHYSRRQGKLFDLLMTCLLLGYPVPIALLWWGHEVCAFDPVLVGPNRFGIRHRNSWANWGYKGFGVLEESHAKPDDAVAPLVVGIT